MPIERERLKIGILFIAGGASAAPGSYDAAHNEGIEKTRVQLGLRESQILRRSGVADFDEAATEYAIRELAARGANLVIATSDGHAGVMSEMARAFPRILFSQIYAAAENGSNLASFFGRVYDPRYLSGIVAGRETVTGKIGYVAARGLEDSQVMSGLNAFAMGVERANPSARVLVKVTRRWFDPVAETEAARSLIAQGCDVIAQHADTINPQLAAREAGAWSVGYNADASLYAPETALVSVVWDWSVYYSKLARSALDGTFRGTRYMGGMEDGLVGLSPLNPRLLGEDDAQAVESARGEIASGERSVFWGVIETGDGTRVGRPGEAWGEETIRDDVHWRYRNVEELP
jgi:basic membrane protein A